MPVIKISNLTKDYGGGRGVFDLSFEVLKGSVMGFLGPNGAGKTTTIRQLMGFIKSDSGSIEIEGLHPFSDAPRIHSFTAYLPGDPVLIDGMTGSSYLNYCAKLRGIRDSKKRKQLLSYFELDPDIRIKKMSKGTKQKVALVSTFMGDERLFILDEPTSGLDPIMQNRFIEYINELRTEGKTVLMSSHIFDEVERCCDETAIIKDGKLVSLSTVKEAKEKRRKNISVMLGSLEDAAKLALKFSLSQDNNRVFGAINNDYTELMQMLSTFNILDIDISSQSLEEYFMHFYKGE